MPPRRKTPEEVFISYANQDLAFVRRLTADLKRMGIRTWYSKRHIGGAEEWLANIGDTLERCDWLVVILTPAAIKSMWVKREVSFAFNEKRYVGRIVPVVLKKCVPKKLAWPLATIQTIDARSYASGLRSLLAVWGIR